MAGSSTGGNGKLQKELKFEFLNKITAKFSQPLGTGAFGSAYKGTLEDGRFIVVKRLEENAPGTHDEKAFRTMVQSIMALKHENILQVVAFCREEIKKRVRNDGEYSIISVIESSLCYEYIPTGNLHTFLFENRDTGNIKWETRFGIVKGICRGLLFLHKLSKRIVHLDLKPKNILLDDRMIPKIGDFAFSRLFGPENSRKKTKSSIGSVGYMAPEYLYKGEISTRSDIYSLGLMIIEISTGEENWPSDDQKSARKFIDEVKEEWDEYKIMDEYPDLDEDSRHQVYMCIKIGLECVDLNQNNRPSIDQIVRRLNV